MQIFLFVPRLRRLMYVPKCYFTSPESLLVNAFKVFPEQTPILRNLHNSELGAQGHWPRFCLRWVCPWWLISFKIMLSQPSRPKRFFKEYILARKASRPVARVQQARIRRFSLRAKISEHRGSRNACIFSISTPGAWWTWAPRRCCCSRRSQDGLQEVLTRE